MEWFVDRTIRAWRSTQSWPWVAAAWAVFTLAAPALADYTFEALGTFGELASEPAAINDAGRVTGTLTGT